MTPQNHEQPIQKHKFQSHEVDKYIKNQRIHLQPTQLSRESISVLLIEDHCPHSQSLQKYPDLIPAPKNCDITSVPPPFHRDVSLSDHIFNGCSWFEEKNLEEAEIQSGKLREQYIGKKWIIGYGKGLQIALYGLQAFNECLEGILGIVGVASSEGVELFDEVDYSKIKDLGLRSLIVISPNQKYDVEQEKIKIKKLLGNSAEIWEGGAFNQGKDDEIIEKIKLFIENR